MRYQHLVAPGASKVQNIMVSQLRRVWGCTVDNFRSKVKPNISYTQLINSKTPLTSSLICKI